MAYLYHVELNIHHMTHCLCINSLEHIISAFDQTSNKTVAMSTLDQLWNISLLRKNYLGYIYIYMYGQPLIMAIRWYHGSRVQDKQVIRYSTNTASVANSATVLLLSVIALCESQVHAMQAFFKELEVHIVMIHPYSFFSQYPLDFFFLSVITHPHSMSFYNLPLTS